MLAIFALVYTALELDKPMRSLKVVTAQMPLFHRFIPAIMFVLAILMVSNVRYSTLKTSI